MVQTTEDILEKIQPADASKKTNPEFIKMFLSNE
jgi:hypothetical protein